MGQQQTVPRSSYQTARSYPTSGNEQFYNKRIQHEGLLKLRDVPFKNCIQIQKQSTSLFLENIQITLKDLLQSRLYTNKLFPKEDIQKLIQNTTYTLAYMQQNMVPYKDVDAQNVFFDDGVFKLLPNQLIPQPRYKKFLYSVIKNKQSYLSTSTVYKQFIALSPQMIIAYRCKQTNILDMDILDKSNVFYLGLLLLQVATLLPSHECYDIETSDILDEVITERIQLVKEYYYDEIASIVANMLDYDYAERMNFKQLSIFVNRQLNKDFMHNKKINKELSNKKPSQIQAERPINLTQSQKNVEQNQNRLNHSNSKSISICKSRIQDHDQIQSRISKPSQVRSISQKKRKNNKIYIDSRVQPKQQQESAFTRQERNKAYIKSSEQRKQFPNNERPFQNGLSTTELKQVSCLNNNNVNGSSRIRQQSGKSFNLSNTRQNFIRPTLYNKPKTAPANNQEQEQNRCPQTQTEQYSQKYMKRKKSTDYQGYRAHNNSRTPTQQKYQQSIFQRQDQYERQPLKQKNHYQQQYDCTYPKKQGVLGPRFVERQSLNEDSGSRGYFDENKLTQINAKLDSHSEFKHQDHSLSRIKSQIQRSRKLIQEFKRGQNCQY